MLSHSIKTKKSQDLARRVWTSLHSAEYVLREQLTPSAKDCDFKCELALLQSLLQQFRKLVNLEVDDDE